MYPFLCSVECFPIIPKKFYFQVSHSRDDIGLHIFLCSIFSNLVKMLVQRIFILCAVLSIALSATVKYTLHISRGPSGTPQGDRVLVNGKSPGPQLTAIVGDTIEVTVINDLADGETTTVHWHGMDQRGTPFSDGVIGVTQCAISTEAGKNSMVYSFVPDRAGTYWYHGHVHEQYIDGLYGALIVNRKDEAKYWAAHRAAYAHDSNTLLIADYYQNYGSSYLPWYISPVSGGDEPMPERFMVNGQFSEQLRLYARKDKTKNAYRIRMINAAAFSMFTISFDGLPLTLIELDGTPVNPVDVNSVVLNAAQRASFIIDYTRLDAALKTSPAIWFRVLGMPEMYPTYDPEAEGLGLRSSATNEIVPMEWKGIVVFTDDDDESVETHSHSTETNPAVTVPSYAVAPTLNYVSPRETNFLDARPIDTTLAPAPTHSMYYEIVFSEDEAGINRPHVNGFGYVPPSDTAPMLFDYLQTSKLRKTNSQSMRNSPLLENTGLIPITGSGAEPFVVPYRAVVEILVNNTDGGEHPMHLHGHSFWIVATSEYPEAEELYSGYYLKRDIASVPAQGWVKMRFVADNPGVWPFHCHIDWHMALGLFTNIIEAPDQLRLSNKKTFGAIPSSQIAACPARPARRLAEATQSSWFSMAKNYLGGLMI